MFVSALFHISKERAREQVTEKGGGVVTKTKTKNKNPRKQ